MSRPFSSEGTSDSDEAFRQGFVEARGVRLDPFQREAFSLLEKGRSVLVAAPTGSGKTLVAEYAVARCLAWGQRAYYTTPIKALSNQKYHDLVRVYGGGRVGLLTGDVSLNGGAEVVVMTTEVLRNMIYDDPAGLGGLGCVVLDEVHYLEDPYRGAVWEEIILTAPRSIGLVYLSATVSNAEEFARWIESVRGETAAVIEERRPIHLEHRYVYKDRHRHELVMLTTFDEAGRPNRRGLELDRSISRTSGHRRGARRPASGGSPIARARRSEVAEVFERAGMLPAIYFIFSRAGCDDAVGQCLEAQIRLTSPEERAEIRAITDAHVDALSDRDLGVLGYRRFLAGLEAGVAPHHAGMVPPFREAVEELFERALIKVVFATETLALGINMPARSVVIESLSKFTGVGHVDLTPGEYTQLTGRAGRRGIDEVGYAAVLYSPFSSFSEVSSLASTRSRPLGSSFRPTYNMVANLVRRYRHDEARALVSSSFAEFLSKRPLTRDLEEVIGLLEARGYLKSWHLTESGRRLTRLYHDCDLLLSEVIGAGVFEGLEPPELAGLVSLFVFEARREKIGSDDLGDPALNDRAGQIDALAAGLRAEERRHRLPVTRDLERGFASLAASWAAGRDLVDVLAPGPGPATRRGPRGSAERLAPSLMPGGDFVRNIKQLVDLLRQISTVTTGEVQVTSTKASELLVRGIVEASTVPFAPALGERP